MKQRRINPEILPYECSDLLERMAQFVSLRRRQIRWTQADLAAKAEVGLSTVAQMERGAPSVQIGHWLKVFWALQEIGRLSQLVDPASMDPRGVADLLGELPKRVQPRRKR